MSITIACLTELKTIVRTERTLRFERKYRPYMSVGKYKGQYLDKVPMSYVKFMHSKHTDDHKTLAAEIERRAGNKKPIRFWHDNAEKLPQRSKRSDGSLTRPITSTSERLTSRSDTPWYKTALDNEIALIADPLLIKGIDCDPKVKPEYEWWQMTATEPAKVNAMDGTVTIVPHDGGRWKIRYSKALRDENHNSVFYEADNAEPVAFMPANSVVLYTNKNKTDSGHLLAGREYFMVKERPTPKRPQTAEEQAESSRTWH